MTTIKITGLANPESVKNADQNGTQKKPSKFKRLTLDKLAFWAEQKAAKQERIVLPGGLSDVYNVILKHGARSNTGLMNRLYSRGIDTFRRSSRCRNFDNVALFIVANVDLKTRTFSLNGGTQHQAAVRLGVSQSTISRILALMIKMGVIRHAFNGDNDPRNPRSGLIYKQGIPLNNIYYVCDDFGYLAGQTAGDKFVEAFEKADQKASECGLTLVDRILVVRNTLWEGTIERRIKGISTGCLKKTICKLTDRSRAATIIYKRALKRGELVGMTEDKITSYVNILLSKCGFGKVDSIPV